MLQVGWAVHMTTDYSAPASCFKPLTNISHINIGSTYLVIQHMNAALLLLTHTRNYRDHPSLMNKNQHGSDQAMGWNLNMQLIFGKADFPDCMVYQYYETIT